MTAKKVQPKWSFNRKLLAKMILDKRIKDNLSFGSITEATGISKSVMYNFEAAKGSPSVEMLARVCDWLNVSPVVFFETAKK